MPDGARSTAKKVMGGENSDADKSKVTVELPVKVSEEELAKQGYVCEFEDNRGKHFHHPVTGDWKLVPAIPLEATN